MPRVLVMLAHGFEETEAVAVIDVLRRADVEVVTAGLEPGAVVSAHGIRLIPDVRLDQVSDQDFDAVVLPGGLEGTHRLADSDLVSHVLDRAAAGDRIIAAICAAPTVLESRGMLAGRRATCHASMRSELRSAGFTDEPVVTDGKVVTSRGVGTALGFGLELVTLLAGRSKAVEIAAAIHFDSR
jgi:4-methyl-5(b-hydroxyethyl)-thiazole monophosphate biosynthesis